MIIFYTVEEKLLKETIVSINDMENYRVVFFQLYMSIILPGPLFPMSPKMARVYDNSDKEVPVTAWSSDLKKRLKEEKKKIPFQYGLFRNLFVVILFFSIMAVVLRVNRSIESSNKQEQVFDLKSEISNIQQGQIYRVVFMDTQSLQLGLIKVTDIEGDTISFVRSISPQEYVYGDENNKLNLSDFSSTIEKTEKSLIQKSDDGSRIFSIAPEEYSSSKKMIGRIIERQE